MKIKSKLIIDKYMIIRHQTFAEDDVSAFAQSQNEHMVFINTINITTHS
jgi:hypothetical protein